MPAAVYRAGQRVRGFGLASYSAFAQAQADLDNQVLAPASAAAKYYAADVAAFALDFSDVVGAVQAAGAAATSSVGPEIDAAGARAVTAPLVLQARGLGAMLAALPKTGLPDPRNKLAAYYSQSDADQASLLLSQMVALYQRAIAQGALAAPGGGPARIPPPGDVTPTPAPAAVQSSSKGPIAVVLVAAAAVAAVALAWKGVPRHAPA